MSESFAYGCTMSKAPPYEREVTLRPIDLHNPQEVSDLIVQRKLCGWSFSNEVVAKWRDFVDKGLKTMFWIILPGENNLKAGHIALGSRAEPHDPDLAQEDRSIMTIGPFFILPKYRSGGIGRKAMDYLESMATKEPYGSPKCKVITLDAISKKYYEPGNPTWPLLMPLMGKQPSNQLWYERRGYVSFKVEPRYEETSVAGPEVLDAVFLRKEL